MLRKPLSLELVKMAICLQGEREMGQLGEIQGRAGRRACLQKLGTFEDRWDRQKLNATGKVIDTRGECRRSAGTHLGRRVKLRRLGEEVFEVRGGLTLRVTD